jgi:hypothetical protein
MDDQLLRGGARLAEARLMRLSALAVCVLLVAGACSDADDSDCPIHIDAPVDAFAFPDAPPIDAAIVDAPIDAVFDTLPPLDAPNFEHPAHAEMMLAVRLLTKLEDRIDDYVVNDAFPILNQAFTPAATCCSSGDYVCPENAAAWQGNAWAQLDFSIDRDHALVYRVQSNGAQLEVVARIDADCDGVTGDVTLLCIRDPGQTRCQMTWPGFIE